MKILTATGFAFCLLFTLCLSSSGQTYYKVLPDSIKIINAELIIGNSTQQVKGFLYNNGNGVTQFQKLRLANIGDSAIAIAGQDTLQWSGGSVGKFYVLSKEVNVQPYFYYHPLAFQSVLDSGKMYKVHAIIYLKTAHPDDNTSDIRLHYSDTTLDDIASVNTSVDSAGEYIRYSLQYDKLIQSKISNDTLGLSFETSIDDTSGTMMMDSLSYMYLEPVTPTVFTDGFTIDTTGGPPLKQNEYYVTDSAIFNFTPVALHLPGYTDVAGNPSSAVITATASNHWGVSSIAADLWHPSYSGTSALDSGEINQAINDLGGYPFDSMAVTKMWVNHNVVSDTSAPVYNLELTGLHPSSLYRIQIIGSRGDEGLTNTLAPGRSQYIVENNSSYGIQKIAHSLNGWTNTSSYNTWDTITPNSSGQIKIAIDGWAGGAGYEDGNISILKVIEMSKTKPDPSSKVFALFSYKDHATITVSDGIENRQGLIYYPHIFDSTKKYPLLLYLAGQESAGTDLEPLRQYGVARMEENGDDLYGITATADTMRFIVVTVLSDITAFSFDTAQIRHIVTNIKAMTQFPIDTAYTYITGFSSGAGSSLNAELAYPYLFRACVPISVATTLNTAVLSSARIGSSYIMMLAHSDAFENNMKAYYDSIYNHNPNNVMFTEWYDRYHSGFNWDYNPMNKRIENGQSIYDFLANPNANINTFARFAFTTGSASSTFLFNDIKTDPSTVIAKDTDKVTGIWLSTITTSGWAGHTSTSIPQLSPAGIGDAFGYNISKNCAFTNGTIASPNLEFGGLAAGAKYDVILYAGVVPTVSPARITQFTIGGSTQILYNNGNYDNYVTFSQIAANGSGHIDVTVQAGTVAGASTYGILTVAVIRKSLTQ